MTDLIELMKGRRSIRRYTGEQISRDALEKVLTAGAAAPNAGSGQRSIILGIRDRALTEKIGRMNFAAFDRGNLAGSHVSAEQPSLIDDPSIKNGFYGAPAVCAVFSPLNFLYGVADAFCCAENMVLEARELGLASCIVARGEDTFNGGEGRKMLADWGIPDGWAARCFVLLGYCRGEYPPPKAIKAGRRRIIDEEDKNGSADLS